MGKGDNKPRGRMSAYAFFVQTCREEHKKKHPNENVVFAEFSKKCAERWKTMSEKEKQRFHQMAEKDKKRYESEMANYKPVKGEKTKKRKRTKDPNAPKRALSAFFWFCNDERPKAKESLPDAPVGEIAKELGRRWNEVTDETKAKYEALAAKDKARYEKEVKAYKGKKAKAGGGAKAGGAKKKDESDEEEEESPEEEEEVVEEDDVDEEEEEEEDDE
ncbi:high mobility group protein B2-like [Centruroides sculpturatus]|uniref:high mobility group protein B2-like n=1 Tax=Centruroides sculpturatus TaxID=218467 RepID=UPI000C6EE220|nr:high mobility group protein B2-like [Centruroides sculpturatus]XP_023222552.1 high mobility group protein B2-like [Centruroides sculpturatus]